MERRTRWIVASMALLSGCVENSVSRRVSHESFVQPSRDNGVDILWVIDDSRSMAEEKDQLVMALGAFVELFATVDVDFRLGVVSTDLENFAPGTLRGAVLTPDTPDLEDTFAAQIGLEAEGSRDERGFDAALSVLDPSLGFSRANADLEIIFFSDEDDHSDQDAAAFVAALHAARPGALIGIDPIVGDLPEGCVSLLAAADPGFRYVDALELTEGLRQSICASDYDSMLRRVALRAIGMRDHFLLAEVPEPSTMEVRVDGVLLHQRSPHGWRYDAGTNEVVVDGYAVPLPGSELSVRYYEWQGLEPPEEVP